MGDLACDCDACGMPALTLAAGAVLGMALTAGWIVPAAWAILRDPLARTVAGLPW